MATADMSDSSQGEKKSGFRIPYVEEATLLTIIGAVFYIGVWKGDLDRRLDHIEKFVNSADPAMFQQLTRIETKVESVEAATPTKTVSAQSPPSGSFRRTQIELKIPEIKISQQSAGNRDETNAKVLAQTDKIDKVAVDVGSLQTSISKLPDRIDVIGTNVNDINNRLKEIKEQNNSDKALDKLVQIEKEIIDNKDLSHRQKTALLRELIRQFPVTANSGSQK
jgi:wobble nucleotide-excising tRNase